MSSGPGGGRGEEGHGNSIVDDPVAELITTFNELNPDAVEQLAEEPSPLEFMRHVARNAPFVVRQGAGDWPAVKAWSAAYLREALRGHLVNVAVTPHGNADAPTPLAGSGAGGGRVQNGDDTDTLVFAKPHEEAQPFEEFLDYIVAQELDPENTKNAEVRYAQTQNDNLRHEYASLFSQVQRGIPFARIALQSGDPDAINMWVGNSRSVTALHRDNYENIYVQVRGRKHFVLLPPLCQPCVNEQELVPAIYVRRPYRGCQGCCDRDGEGVEVDDDDDREGGDGDEDKEDEEGCAKSDDRHNHHQYQDTTQENNPPPSSFLELRKELDADKVPFATWDPDSPSEQATPYSHLAAPIRVTLDPGDMLYLPAMWYHKVSQSCSEDGICVAVNYWYDMDFSGPHYPLASFVRNVSHHSHHYGGHGRGGVAASQQQQQQQRGK